MVKILVDKPAVEIQFSGNPITVAAELAVVIAGIHRAMENEDPAKGRTFRKKVQRFFAKDSLVWKEDIDMTVITVPVKKEKDNGH